MATFTIHASKDGEAVTTTRISPTLAVAKARSLITEGWQVHITDGDGRQYQPEQFYDVLAFDRRPPIKF